MSFPALSSLTARPSVVNVTFVPGGPETERRVALILAGRAEHAFTAARNATLAASRAVPSKLVYGFAPLTWLFQYAANAFPAGPPAALAAVPRSPSTGEPIFARTSPLRIASVISVFVALHLPDRTSDGANFSNVSGKSMITKPAGFPWTSFCASVSNVACVGFQETLSPILPPRFAYSVLNSASSAVPNASFRAPTLTVAPLPNASTAACASTFPWRASDGYVRHRYPLSLIVVSCGALDVGEICTTRFGIVTDCAIGIVAPDAISPITTLALFDLMSFVAASTDALACV